MSFVCLVGLDYWWRKPRLVFLPYDPASAFSIPTFFQAIGSYSATPQLFWPRLLLPVSHYFIRVGGVLWGIKVGHAEMVFLLDMIEYEIMGRSVPWRILRREIVRVLYSILAIWLFQISMMVASMLDGWNLRLGWSWLGDGHCRNRGRARFWNWEWNGMT